MTGVMTYAGRHTHVGGVREIQLHRCLVEGSALRCVACDEIEGAPTDAPALLLPHLVGRVVIPVRVAGSIKGILVDGRR